MCIVKRSVAHGLALDSAHGLTHLWGMEANAKLYTTVAVDPNNGYQATSKTDTGHWAQYAVTGPHTWAVRCTYSHSDAVTFQHGPWDEQGARRFAASMGTSSAKAVQVAPYYYCEAWGRVPAASVGPLDAERMGSWRHPLRPGQVLASDTSHPLGGGVNVEASK